MAQEQPSLEESPLDRALSQTRGTFDPETVTSTPDGLMGGHPAQEEEVEEDEVDGGVPPAAPAEPEPPPVTPPPLDQGAEQRRLDSERRMHLSMQEADALRADRDRLQRQADELQKQISAPATPATTREDPDRATALAKMKDKLREVSAIDNQLSDYWERLSQGWGEALDPLIEARATAIYRRMAQEQDAAIDQRVQAQVASIEQRVQSQVAEATENTLIFRSVVDEAAKAGYGVAGESTPGFRSLPLEQQIMLRADADIFWNVAVARADEQLPQGTTEERTAAAIETMRRLKPGAAPVAPTPPVTNHRPPRQPMGRQSAGPTAPSSGTPEPPSPISLDDAITNTHGRNRV